MFHLFRSVTKDHQAGMIPGVCRFLCYTLRGEIVLVERKSLLFQRRIPHFLPHGNFLCPVIQSSKMTPWLLLALLVQSGEDWTYQAEGLYLHSSTLERKSPQEFYDYGMSLGRERQTDLAVEVFDLISRYGPGADLQEKSFFQKAEVLWSGSSTPKNPSPPSSTSCWGNSCASGIFWEMRLRNSPSSYTNIAAPRMEPGRSFNWPNCRSTSSGA